GQLTVLAAQVVVARARQRGERGGDRAVAGGADLVAKLTAAALEIRDRALPGADDRGKTLVHRCQLRPPAARGRELRGMPLHAVSRPGARIGQIQPASL